MPSGSGGNIAPYAARRDRGLATCFSVPPLCPTWPPLFLSDLPRRLPAMRGGFFSPSLDGGLLLFELSLLNRRWSSAIVSRCAAFSRRNAAYSSQSSRRSDPLSHPKASRLPPSASIGQTEQGTNSQYIITVHAESANAMAAAGGLFAGLFWGRTLGQFARAMQADGEPVTLRGLVDLVTARPSPSAP